MTQKEPFDDTTKTIYSALFKRWGLDVETERAIFARSRSIDLVIQCQDVQQNKLQHTVFSYFRQLNALELKGPNDPLTIKDYNRIMMRAWGLGAVEFKPEQEQHSRLPKQRTLTIVCINRPQKILDTKQDLFGFKSTEQQGIYLSKGYLNQWLIYPSELALVEKNYPLLVLAKGEKLKQFIDVCIRDNLHDYLDLTLRMGTINDPRTAWQEILKVKEMSQVNTIDEETWATIDQFFKETPEGFSKVKSFQERLMEQWRNGKKVGRDEGREEGLEKGELKKARSTLVHLLCKKFGGLPEEIIERIEKTEDQDRLQEWFDLAITAAKFDDIEFL